MALPVEETTEEFARLNQLGAEDPTLKEMLINMFLEQAPELMANIKTQANNQQPVDTKNAAHTFKGVCFNLGFEPAGMLCKDIEEAALAEDFAQVASLHATLESNLADLYAKLNAMLD